MRPQHDLPIPRRARKFDAARDKVGTDPEPATCENHLDRNYALGQRVGVTGTPMIYDAQGGIGGYLPPDQMLARLDAIK